MVLVNVMAYGDPLGFEPHDALFYRECGEDMGNADFSYFFVWLTMHLEALDDWGFPSLVWFLYHVFGDCGSYALLFLNAFVIAFGARRLYYLSCNFLNNEYALMVALLWGIMPFSVTTAASGLKENFFLFVIISFFYYLYRYKSEKKLFLLAIVLLYIAGIFLFRFATGCAAIICLLSIFFINCNFIRNNLKTILLLFVIICVTLLPLFAEKIAEAKGDSIENISEGASRRTEEAGGIVAFCINSISALIGPIPTFISKDSGKLTYITRYSFSPYVKIFISFFFYYALWHMYKRKQLCCLPMIIFIAINILMITFAFFALHVRYHWPHMPLFLIISAIGIYEYQKSKHAHHIFMLYTMACVSLILIFNFK